MFILTYLNENVNCTSTISKFLAIVEQDLTLKKIYSFVRLISTENHDIMSLSKSVV